MLYLVSTPIGNLQDMTHRAVEVLRSCSLILCEDTRHSRVLLDHYGITTHLKSYHQFNEASREEEVLRLLREGQTLALISDAGTPAISDPGERLVKACLENELSVSAVPGPCALIQALVCSGLPTEPFQYRGFLPRTPGERRQVIVRLLHYDGTTLFYESPQRVLETLEVLVSLIPERQGCIARELTKTHEEYLRGSLREIYEELQKRDRVRGEMVLLISGAKDQDLWEGTDPLEQVKELEQTYGLSQKEALKLTAELRQMPKRLLYNAGIQKGK